MTTPEELPPRYRQVLLTVRTEVIHDCRQFAVGVNRNVEGLVDQEVVPRTLPDDPEVVDGGARELPVDERASERVLCDTGALVLVTRGESGTTYSLRVDGGLYLDPVAVDGQMK